MSLDVNISEPDEFNCIELHSCLKDLTEVLGISDFEYHVEHISGGGGENYIANIFRVVIKETDTNNSVRVIVKTLVNTARQELFHDLHKREVAVYKYVLPKFKELQNSLGDRQKVIFPECLHSNSEKTKEVIIFKDLSEIGFILDDTLTKFEELNFERVELILKELAKFHALSFKCENVYNEEFGTIKQKFNDILFQESFLNKSKLRNYFFESFDMSLNLVTDLEAKRKLEKVRPKLLELLKAYNQSSKYNVLCHGDLWMNNILFMEENDDCKICFLDFQAMRYASPVNDIIYFIYLCTTPQFRSENFEKLLSTYYDSLNSSLMLHDIDINTVYPRNDFKIDVKEKLPYGLLVALVEMRIITMTPEDDAILKGGKKEPGSNLMEVPGEIELFKYRVNELVQESVRNGVLDQTLSKLHG